MKCVGQNWDTTAKMVRTCGQMGEMSGEERMPKVIREMRTGKKMKRKRARKA